MSQTNRTATTSPRHARGMLLRPCFWMATLLVLVILLSGLEWFARHGLGLGDPPLMMHHPEIEYMFVPGRYQRFGNQVRYNRYSMRSEDFPIRRQSDEELRIMFLGDSVINGGAQTDQAALATERIREQLEQQLQQPVIVGNISAGSWGPGNQWAYVEHFGLFDADLVVLVISSHDAFDARTFEPIVGVHPGFPDQTPRLALGEFLGRYVLPRLGWRHSTPEPAVQLSDQERRDKALHALDQLIRHVNHADIPMMVALHWERTELERGRPDEGHHLIRERADQVQGVHVVNLGEHFLDSAWEIEQAYRDDIHPTAHGQALLARMLYPHVEQLIVQRLEAEPPASD